MFVGSQQWQGNGVAGSSCRLGQAGEGNPKVSLGRHGILFQVAEGMAVPE